MRQDNLDYSAAREKAMAYMKTMPAWRDVLQPNSDRDR
jgi:hypothetical protein